MKKILICLICLNLVTSLSFASASASSNVKTSEKTAKSKVSTKAESKTASNSHTVKPEAKKEEVKKDSYQIPSDIKEPEVITLPPTTNTWKEDHVEEELVIIDLPPLTDESEEKKEAVKETKTPPKADTANSKSDNTKKPEKKETPQTKGTDKDNKKETINKAVPKSVEEVEEIVEEEKTIVKNIKPSRTVTLKRKEYVNITYPGTGWIYVGITDGSKDLLYFGRALGTKDTTFSLQAKIPGVKVLHFCKNDYITGEYLDDYIEVIILEEEGSNKTHVDAPVYKQPKPASIKDDKNTSDKKTDSQKTPAENGDKTSETKEENNVKDEKKTEEIKIGNPETLLKEAEMLFNEKKFQDAYNKLDLFFKCGTEDLDRALFLKGNILESKSNMQNIKNAIEVYTKLTKEYPASKYWDKANKRIIYLKRFYEEAR